MITVKNNYFKIDTPHTTYLFKKNPLGNLEHLYYGQKIPTSENYLFLEEEELYGGGIVSENKQYRYYENCASLEYGCSKRSDAREGALKIAFTNHDSLFVLTYDSYQILSSFSIPNLPTSFDQEEILAITLKDKIRQIAVCLYYVTYRDSDMISKFVSVTNESKTPLVINRIMSSCFDILEDEYDVISLTGGWGKERQINKNNLGSNITKISSNYGFSSAQINPFTMLAKKNVTNDHGDVYAFNLLYSGNHMTAFEKNPYHKIRIMTGINDYSFSWTLKEKETFFTPEMTQTFSSHGFNQITATYHEFIHNHIIRSPLKNQIKPILINNWEGMYFDFNEDKIIALATKAKELGIEMLVLDDGWFGNRNDDTTSLGDWFPNLNKLPNGIKGLSKKIHDLGLKFGLWVEPEMISPKSELYKTHPEWAIASPLYSPLLHRNQLVLDLTNNEVVEYVSKTIINLIKEGNIDYIKWDCNRNIGDYYSNSFTNQEEFLHRYILGLYHLMDNITSKFPNVLFESCSAGGNRVDLGMLYYMPQFWCSDNTDAYARMMIQKGTLICYPPSCMGAHVSSSLSKQTLRFSSYDNKFNVAAFGAFGYELDLNSLSEDELSTIKEEIVWYKKHRELLQFGKYYQTSDYFDNSTYQFSLVSKDQKEALYFLGAGVFEAYQKPVILKPKGLKEEYTYSISTRKQKLNPLLKQGEYAEIDSASLKGETLMNAGFRISYEWLSGNSKKRRIMEDFGSRIYEISKI